MTLLQGNILIDEDGTPLLCDFGLSRIRHEVTRTKSLLGAAGFPRALAPELGQHFIAMSALGVASPPGSGQMNQVTYSLLAWRSGLSGTVDLRLLNSVVKAQFEKFVRGGDPNDPTEMRAYPLTEWNRSGN